MRLGPNVVFLVLVCTLNASADEIRVQPVGLTLIDEAEVAAQGMGPIVDVIVREGQVVSAGDLLARIDDRDAQIELQQAQIDFENAKQVAENDLKVLSHVQALKLTELDLARAEQSIERYAKSVSQAQLDRLKVSVEQARLQLAHAKKELDTAQLGLSAAANRVRMAERSLERMQVRAPIDGVVVASHLHQGEWVEPGVKMFRVVRTDRLRAEGFVHLDQLSPELANSQVTFQTSVNGSVIQALGQITFVSPEASPVNGQVRIWAEIENPQQRLRAGVSGSLLIHPDGADQEPTDQE